MDKKIAIVTGASRGIGQAIAIELIKNDYFVIGTATSEQGAQAISESLGDQACGVMLNLKDKDASKELIARLMKDYGRIDALVNNAGITQDNLFLRMSESDWENVIDTNLNGLFHITKACIRPMIKQKSGAIVNISSVVASMGNPGQVNYASSKAAVEGFTRSLSKEYAAHNIRVNAIAPGFIETDMTQAIPEAHREQIINHIPAKRLGKPEDIAHLVNFLLSDQAAYILGAIIPINGAMYCH